LKHFVSGKPDTKRAFCQENRDCPKETSAKRVNFLASFEKIETPRKGQNTSDTEKAFPRQTTKRLLGRDEFFQMIFLSKSQDWVIVGG